MTSPFQTAMAVANDALVDQAFGETVRVSWPGGVPADEDVPAIFDEAHDAVEEGEFLAASTLEPVLSIRPADVSAAIVEDCIVTIDPTGTPRRYTVRDVQPDGSGMDRLTLARIT